MNSLDQLQLSSPYGDVIGILQTVVVTAGTRKHRTVRVSGRCAKLRVIKLKLNSRENHMDIAFVLLVDKVFRAS